MRVSSDANSKNNIRIFTPNAPQRYTTIMLGPPIVLKLSRYIYLQQPSTSTGDKGSTPPPLSKMAVETKRRLLWCSVAFTKYVIDLGEGAGLLRNASGLLSLFFQAF